MTAPARWRTVLSTLVLLVGTVASVRTLETVVAPGPWTGLAALLVAVTALAVCAARLLQDALRAGRRSLPSSIVPTLAGLVVATWSVLARFGSPTGSFDPVVGTSSVGRVLSRIGTARRLASEEVAPIDPSLPVVLAVAAAGVAAFLVADLVSAVLRLPAAAAVPLVALWSPSLVIEGTVPGGAFAVTILCLVILLALDPPVAARPLAVDARVTVAHAAAGAARVVTGGVAVAAVALLVAAGAGGWGAGLLPGWKDLFATQGSSVQLSDDLDLLQNLGPRSDDVVLRYTTPEELGSPLRVYTATAFDGSHWSRGTAAAGSAFADDDVLWPERAPRTDDTTIDVRLESYRDALLPITTEPRRVVIDDTWRYSPDRDQVERDRPNPEGYEYTLVESSRDLTPDGLRASDGDDVDDSAYLDVPTTPHAADTAALAQDLTRDSSNRYDSALALQTYLRDTSRFTYSTDLPTLDSEDAVWTFLQDRTGYCVQFATAMTVMARDVGIPARLAVGFLPGDRTVGTSTYEVTGTKSHAWPELYFPGTGWVRFEPTPSVQTGPAPAYADPLLQGSDSGDDAPATAASTAPRDERPSPPPTAATSSSSAAATVGGSSTSGAPRILVGAGLLAVAVLAALGAALVVRRRRGLRPEEDEVEAAWASLRSRLDRSGLGWPDSLTPRQVPDAVVAAVTGRRAGPVEGAPGGPSTDEDDVTMDEATMDDATLRELSGTLSRVAAIVEDRRYAKSPEPVDVPGLMELVDRAVATARSAVSGRPSRDGAPSAPRGG